MLTQSDPTLFQADPYKLFCRAVKNYCATIGHENFELSEDELQQLSWYMTSTVVSPEARNVNPFSPLHFEVMRSLSRRISFELLLKGDRPSYEKFIKEQSQPLSYEEFEVLAEEAQALPANVVTIIKLSCLLTITEKAKSTMQISLNDSEEFLTRLADVLQDPAARQLLPIAKTLTPAQAAVLKKIYWPNMHLRHMLQTEGGDNMTATFNKGIADGEFSQADYLAWKWRWLTVSFGFSAGSGAKYYDKNVHMLTMMVTSELEKSFSINPQYSYLDGYLIKRAELAGLDDDSEKVRYFLGHLAAYSNQVQIIDYDSGAIVRSGYELYRIETGDHGALAESYHRVRKNLLTVTPTYVTSVYSTAYAILYQQHIDDKRDAPVAKILALKASTQFMCYVFAALFSNSCENRISMYALAQRSALAPILKDWQIDTNVFEFKLNQQFEMTVAKKEAASSTLRI
jgi:hypothetical protein